MLSKVQERNMMNSGCPFAHSRPQPLKYLIQGETKSDKLHRQSFSNPGCEGSKCMGALMRPPPERPTGVVRPVNEVREQATQFLAEYYESLNKRDSPAHKARLAEVNRSLDETGTYDHTYEELSFGAKTAWRNAPRCIGRIQWKNLKLFDARNAKTAQDMYDVFIEHLKYANNGGNLRSCITLFPKRTDGKHDFRVWNSQLITFAGYRNPDGTILGDPAYVDFAEMCIKLGWKPKRTAFDVLPWVLQADGGKPEMFVIPEEHVLLINLIHPKFEWFEELSLKWYAVPAVANMLFDCGGIEYPGAPFSGWYMGTEVGSRDLCDPSRYNLLEVIGKKMGLDTKKNVNLWKDRVLVETNLAVLHSYRTAGVTLVDHHTASEQFMSHLETEYRIRGGCPADWVWIVPPMSSSITPVFHMEMLHYKLKPSYEYQEEIWRTYKFGDEPEREHKLSLKIVSRALRFCTSLYGKALAKRKRCTILYATETGKSYELAKQMNKITSHAFNSRVVCMDDYNIEDFAKENLVLVIASTFGNGDPPDNGRSFFDELKRKAHDPNRKKHSLDHIRFAVFALGSSAYPSFCAFGHNVDSALEQMGAHRVFGIGEGDELQGQDESFRSWAGVTFRAACGRYSIDTEEFMSSGVMSLLGDDMSWSANEYKFTAQDRVQSVDVKQGLEQVHKKNISSILVKAKVQLQSNDSDRKTLFVNLDANAYSENDLAYVPGDHAAVFPSNDPTLVSNIIRLLKLGKLSPDAFFKIQRLSKKKLDTDDWESDLKLPQVTSLRLALTHFLDVTSPPSQHNLEQLAELATSPADRAELENLSKDSAAYSKWRYDLIPSWLDVLKMFSSIRLEPSFLLSQLPVLQPRYYSISSAPSVHTGDIHITVAVVEYRNKNGHGDMRYGVCSNWLNKLNKGDTVHCTVRSAEKFHLPENSSVPIIMVGPGTGIAPLRSFWQQRYHEKKVLKKTVGPTALYFGCRRRQKDNIYNEERRKMALAGVLNEYLALSREPDVPKTYVQDMLSKHGAQVYKYLLQENGHMYVCGDVAMAADVRTRVEKIIQKHGNMSESKAKETLEELRNSNNYHEDIFGTLKAPQAPSTKQAPKDEKPLLIENPTPIQAIQAVQQSVPEFTNSNRLSQMSPPAQQTAFRGPPTYTTSTARTTSPVPNGATSPIRRGAQSPVYSGTTSPVRSGAQSPVSDGAKSPVRSGAKSPVPIGSDTKVKKEKTGLFGKKVKTKSRPVQGIQIQMSTHL